MTHKCKVCGVTSETAEFYNKVNTLCKSCHKKRVKENRAKNVEYYRAYDAARFQNDPRVKERHKRYQKTEKGKESMRAARANWINKSPEARAAHVILGNAIKNGRVEKPTNCSLCGALTKSRSLHGHHEDYAKPLEVTWLCAQCHCDTHGRTSSAKTTPE